MLQELASDQLHDFSPAFIFSQLADKYNDLPMTQFFWKTKPWDGAVLCIKLGQLNDVAIFPVIFKVLQK